ncbi:hypothetical protein X943_000219 [Babesia divergens]|uniref:Uncharacterized protein n=1 Tax=Babesia divergens TaxID=32595 RepID=A0AAD9GJ19_BABDI|nr:hypothetical protein X943_000219 [Babesia divergens]
MCIYMLLRRFFSVINQPARKERLTVKEALERQATDIRDKLRLNSLERYNRELARKEKNCVMPRPVYEGPRNVRYWIRRRRSGMRK